MARIIETEVPASTRSVKRRTFHIAVNSELGKDASVFAGREEYNLINGSPSGAPVRDGILPVQFMGASVTSLSVTLQSGKTMTFAEIAEAVSLFIDKVEEDQS